jgi:uncharacterized membrane protein YhfC
VELELQKIASETKAARFEVAVAAADLEIEQYTKEAEDTVKELQAHVEVYVHYEKLIKEFIDKNGAVVVHKFLERTASCDINAKVEAIGRAMRSRSGGSQVSHGANGPP